MAVSTTQKNHRYFIGVQSADADNPEAQDADLDQAGFEALTWTEIKGVGQRPVVGTLADMTSYDEFGQSVRQHAKAIPDAGQSTMACRNISDDPGQIAMRVAGDADYQSAVAFQERYDDQPSGGSNPTTVYTRMKVSGPQSTNTAPQDFPVDTYNVAFVQKEVRVVAS